MSRYGIKDVFLTLQGEGMRAGTKAVFVRFSGCNLWNGRPVNRYSGEGACSRWCDTDFFKGKVMELEELLADMQEALGPVTIGDKWCVLTGGEPCLQIDETLMRGLTDAGWKIAVETNGTVKNEWVYLFADHVCIAPKLDVDGQPLALLLGDAHEIKVVLPGNAPGRPAWTEEMLREVAATWPQSRLFVQPMDPIVAQDFVEETALKRTLELQPDDEAKLEEQLRKNIQMCIAWVLNNPNWALSLQTHKLLGLK